MEDTLAHRIIQLVKGVSTLVGSGRIGGMDFNTFPAQWEWVALILGVVALVLTIPQMIWGAPKIRVGFGFNNMEHTEYFECRIWNEPITSRLLNFLRVRRETAPEITAFFTIEDKGSGWEVFRASHLVGIKTQTNVMGERVSLPSSFFPATFAIALVSKGDNQVHVYHEPVNDKTELQILPVGGYAVRVELGIGVRVRKISRHLIIQNNYPFAYWDVNS